MGRLHEEKRVREDKEQGGGSDDCGGWMDGGRGTGTGTGSDETGTGAPTFPPSIPTPIQGIKGMASADRALTARRIGSLQRGRGNAWLAGPGRSSEHGVGTGCHGLAGQQSILRAVYQPATRYPYAEERKRACDWRQCSSRILFPSSTQPRASVFRV